MICNLYVGNNVSLRHALGVCCWVQLALMMKRRCCSSPLTSNRENVGTNDKNFQTYIFIPEYNFIYTHIFHNMCMPIFIESRFSRGVLTFCQPMPPMRWNSAKFESDDPNSSQTNCNYRRSYFISDRSGYSETKTCKEAKRPNKVFFEIYLSFASSSGTRPSTRQ